MALVRGRMRLLGTCMLAGVMALATIALAQPRGGAKPAARPAGRPAPAKDAAPPEEVTDSGKTSAPTEPVPAPPPEVGDTGVRPSPLNPTAPEFPSNAVDAGVPVDYDRLLSDIAALRARVAAVSDTLYQSRVSVAIQLDGDHARIGRLTVAIDDGIVYTAPASFSASDMTTVYDHAVAPGRHAVTIDLDRKDDRDEAFRTSQRNRFTVDVPRDQRVEVTVKLIDDSSMGADYPSDRSGKYDLRVKVKAVSKAVGK